MSKPRSDKSIKKEVLNEIIQGAEDADAIQKMQENRIFGISIEKLKSRARKRLGDRLYFILFPDEAEKSDSKS